MNSSIIKLRKYKKIFGWIFIVSLLIFVFANFPYVFMPSRNELACKIIEFPVLISLVALLTSIASLIGFISTTILAWRKESRESKYTKLEIEKRELEIEKLKTELNDVTKKQDAKSQDGNR